MVRGLTQWFVALRNGLWLYAIIQGQGQVIFRVKIKKERNEKRYNVKCAYSLTLTFF